LFSFIGTHNFSGLLTGSADPYSCCSSGVEGTVDGTAAAGYGVSVYNFTSAYILVQLYWDAQLQRLANGFC